MNNIIVLYKDENGDIYCHELTEKGAAASELNSIEDDGYWKEGGTILLDEIEEILNKEIFIESVSG